VTVQPPASRPLALGDERTVALDHGVSLLRSAWRSFDQARPANVRVSLETLDVMESALPEGGIDVPAALDAAEQVLDESLAQTRPRFSGYVGSSGLEPSVLADALGHRIER
jgi:aromatic-L-amino-acid decarboxylase